MALYDLISLSVLRQSFMVIVLYYVSRTVYRLTLHPLASFPGPRLAAITDLYAMSYDLPRSSSYLKTLPGLHDRYGPIIRAWPNILHIRDLDAYNQIFKPGSKYVKDPSFYQFVMVEHSLFSIIDSKDAKIRKDMFAPYFSRSAISRLESLIHEKISKFLNILDTAASADKAVDMNLGFSCLTADVTMHYCYQKTFGALDAPDFQFRPILAIGEVLDIGPYTWYFPKVFKLIDIITRRLPEATVKKYMPPIAATTWIQRQCRERVLALKSSTKARNQSCSPIPTIFDTMLSPDPSKNQYTPSDAGLQDDACLMFVAGSDTTANTLVNATYHVLSNPAVHTALKAELRTSMPDPNGPMLSWTTLETLPYLRGVVKESLRFAYGVPGRIPRIVPSGGATLAGRHVPAGTIVAAGAYVYHTDDAVFSDAKAFRPERWLEANGGQELEKKLLSFSKGPRACLGINLAYAQLFLTIAHLMRRFDLTLYETTAEDMEWDDCYMPKVRKHLRVKIKKASQ